MSGLDAPRHDAAGPEAPGPDGAATHTSSWSRRLTRLLALAGVVALTALASWALIQASHEADPPYMGLPPAPPHRAVADVWYALAYVVWLVPAAFAVRWWRPWLCWLVVALIAAFAHWYVPHVSYATRLIA